PTNSQLLRIPLLRRAVLRPLSYAPPLSSTPPDPRADRKVTHGQVSVGRADADRFWVYGGNHNTLAGVHTLPGNGRAVPLAVGSHSSRGELQTYSASLRFDAHLTGLRFFMYHFPLLSFFTFTTLFMAFEMATALTLWAVAAIYTSSMAVAPISLDTDEHFQQHKPWRTQRRSDDDYGVKTETETTRSAEESSRFKYDQVEDEEDETEAETETKRRFRGGPRIKVEEYSDDDEAARAAAEEEEMRMRSLESLEAKDAADLAEAIRQSRMRDLLEARRMGGAGPSGTSERGSLIDIVDPTLPISPEELSEIQLSRRVLDRLDEETEEDTDVASSRPSSRLAARGVATPVEGGVGAEAEAWEDLEDESASGESGVEAGAAAGGRSRRDEKASDDEEAVEGAAGESTIGGSATSGRRTIRSFGATTTATGSSSIRTD
ncbi:hypothetical protein, partial [Sporisorium scitamineum]